MALQRILAAVCVVCPFCIVRRAWPQSTYARIMGAVEKGCPFCRAYDDLHKQQKERAEMKDAE